MVEEVAGPRDICQAVLTAIFPSGVLQQLFECLPQSLPDITYSTKTWIQSVWVPKTMSWRKHNKLTRNDTAGIQLKQHSCSSKLHLYFSWNAYFAFVKKNENKKRNDGRFFLRPPATSTVWFVSLQLFVVVASWDGIFVAGLLRLASQNDDFVRNLVPGHQVTHTVPVLFTWAQTMSQTMYLVPLNCCHYLLPVHLSLIHIWRCRRSTLCRSRWSPYH